MFDQFGEQALPTPGHLQHPVRRKNVGLLSSRRVELAGKWTYGTGSGALGLWGGHSVPSGGLSRQPSYVLVFILQGPAASFNRSLYSDTHSLQL